MKLILFATASAVLLQSAFMWPAQCAWMVFIFLIPLLYRVLRFPLLHPFREGVCWGIVFFTGNFFAATLVLYEKARGSFRLMAMPLFIVYCATYVGIWFWMSARIARGRSQAESTLVWTAGAWIYFYWVSHFILWPCGHAVGYCFGSPLVPLAYYPRMLSALGFLGCNLLMICLIGFQSSMTMFFVTKRTYYGLITALCAMPFCLGLFSVKLDTDPEYLSALCYVQPPPKTLSDPFEQAEEINMRITQAVRLKPSTTCILMPESSFTHCLNDRPGVVELWGVNALDRGHILCIGSYRADTYNEYNTLYVIESCRITYYYDKSNLMPLVEYIPSFGKKSSWIRNLFLKQHKEFSPKKDCPRLLTLTQSLSVQPRLCSDLFMEPYDNGDNPTKNSPILFAVNDSWFCAVYAQRLMFLYAVYYAMHRKRDILYVGHTYGCWISHRTGKTILL